MQIFRIRTKAYIILIQLNAKNQLDTNLVSIHSALIAILANIQLTKPNVSGEEVDFVVFFPFFFK